MIKQSLIKLLQDFAATPSDTDSQAIKLYIKKHEAEFLALSPSRTGEMVQLIAAIEHILDSDFDAIKIYRLIDILRTF